MKGPTKKQQEILLFIREYQTKFGCAPLQKEISDKFKITPQAAQSHISRMVKKGLIHADNHKHRSLQIPQEIDRYQLVKNERNILVFKYESIEIPAAEFVGQHFKLLGRF